MKILLLTPKRRFIANQYGVGYQVPLGMLCISGPLTDAGYNVELLDNDREGLSDNDLDTYLTKGRYDCVFVGHTGSTAAHPIAIHTIQVVRKSLPDAYFVSLSLCVKGSRLMFRI